jgi:hypothetical protein
MDLNYLFLRQQVERSLANTAASEPARQAHEDLARAYEQIERKTGGRIMFPKGRHAARETVIEQQISASPSRLGSS